MTKDAEKWLAAKLVGPMEQIAMVYGIASQVGFNDTNRAQLHDLLVEANAVMNILNEGPTKSVEARTLYSRAEQRRDVIAAEIKQLFPELERIPEEDREIENETW